MDLILAIDLRTNFKLFGYREREREREREFATKLLNISQNGDIHTQKK